MSVKSVIFHREDCIRIRFRKIRKYSIAFLGPYLAYLIFQADLGNGILIHIIAADTDGHCKIHNHCTEHSCYSFKPIKRCTLLFPGVSCCIVFSIVFCPHLLTFSPVLYTQAHAIMQAGSSLTAREKQMSASQPLVFLFTGYSITHQYKQVFEAPLKNSD